MTEVGNITLENEMDLILVQKRITNVADYLQFTLATQTVLATAAIEVGREVIDKTNSGRMHIRVVYQPVKYYLSIKITFPVDAGVSYQDEGMIYARKLVPAFEIIKDGEETSIEMLISIPRFVKLNAGKLKEMEAHFNSLPPATHYEAIKIKNHRLTKISFERDEQLRHSKYLSEKKSEFISIASHELKTPLTSIKAYTQIALKASQSECSPKVRVFLEKIDAQSSKLQRLIQQLLDVSTIESGRLDYKVEKVVLTDFITEVTGMLRPVIPNHILHLRLNESKQVVSIDRLRMEQVFINLLTNAAKYSQPETNIYISNSVDELGMQKISIQDEGIGMNKENLNLIFEKFYRENQAIGHYSGMGVGLYISRSIIEQHGGKIWAESEPEKGSVFHFTLPVDKDEIEDVIQD